MPELPARGLKSHQQVRLELPLSVPLTLCQGALSWAGARSNVTSLLCASAWWETEALSNTTPRSSLSGERGGWWPRTPSLSELRLPLGSAGAEPRKRRGRVGFSEKGPGSRVK